MANRYLNLEPNLFGVKKKPHSITESRQSAYRPWKSIAPSGRQGSADAGCSMRVTSQKNGNDACSDKSVLVRKARDSNKMVPIPTQLQIFQI
jgi:hypothetical protein